VLYYHLQRQACPRQLARERPGLDSFGFADLEYAMCFNCALAWHCPYGDPRRIFGQGTPKVVWYLMEQAWAVVSALSNARITEDISGLERVRDKIIEAKGCIVPDGELPDRPFARGRFT
jgi:hypothetical protein